MARQLQRPSNVRIEASPTQVQPVAKALRGAIQPPTDAVAEKRLGMKSCPLCDAQIREDRFQSHVSMRCPFRPKKALVQPRKAVGPVAAATTRINKTLHPAESPSLESLRYKGGAEIEPPAWSNNLDATKNIGYPARESGRYGSHPSHDAFGDESEP